MKLRPIGMAVVAGLLVAGSVVAALVAPQTGGAAETALPPGNLVKNPGGEFPFGGEIYTRNVAPNGWKKGEGDGEPIQVVRYGGSGALVGKEASGAAGGGRNYFAGGYASRLSTVFQTIDVSRAAPEIDAGGVKACLSAFLGGTKGYAGTARVELTFLGEDGAGLGKFRVGPVTRGQRLDASTLLRRATESAVPKNTRQLRVVIRADSGGGPTNLGGADNISVALAKGSCDPVLTVKRVKKTLVATVKPSSIAKTARVRFTVKCGKSTKKIDAARAPYTGRVTTDGLSGPLTVTATVLQKGGGTIVLTKKSGRC